MRIGIFTDAYKPLISGVATSISMLKEGLEELGHDVYIITMLPPDKKYVELDPKVIRVKGFKIPTKSLKYFRYSFRRRKIFKILKKLNLDLDVIHIHTEFTMGKVGLRYKNAFNLPMVYTVHTFYEQYVHHVSKLMSKLMPRISRRIAANINKKFTSRADVTILPTKKVLETANRLNYQGDFKIIPTGINLTPFYKESYNNKEIESLKDELGISKDEFVYMIVARIAKEKSINDLITGFDKHLNNHPNSRFLIVGDGPAKEELEKQIKRLKRDDKINMLGFIPWQEVGKYYQLADCFLNASTTETQGLTYIEALASSACLIVRYDTVLDGVVEDRVNGLFFNTIDELVDKMDEVQSNGDLFEKLRGNARTSIDRFSSENYAKNVYDIYNKLIK